MKIVIPAGSGQVGTILARAFHGGGDQVVVLSRHPEAQTWRVAPWDGRTLGGWQREIDGCDAVINLAGRSVNCRYSPRHRQEILDSRVLSTRVCPGTRKVALRSAMTLSPDPGGVFDTLLGLARRGHSEEPPHHSCSPPRARIRVQVSALAQCRARSLRAGFEAGPGVKARPYIY